MLIFDHRFTYASGPASTAGQNGCAPIGFGETVQGSISAVGEADCFTFDGAAGDRMRVRAIETSGNLVTYVELLRADGTTLCGPGLSAEQTCLLDATGAHTVLVRDYGGTGTGSFNLHLQRLNDPVGCTSPGPGTISAVAEMDCFTFEGKSGDQLVVRVIETSGDLAAYQEVLRPDGTTQCGPTVATEQSCIFDRSGRHVLLVRDYGGSGLGSYVVYLFRFYVHLPLILR